VATGSGPNRRQDCDQNSEHFAEVLIAEGPFWRTWLSDLDQIYFRQLIKSCSGMRSKRIPHKTNHIRTSRR